jgi:hypothetical protein
MSPQAYFFAVLMAFVLLASNDQAAAQSPSTSISIKSTSSPIANSAASIPVTASAPPAASTPTTESAPTAASSVESFQGASSLTLEQIREEFAKIPDTHAAEKFEYLRGRRKEILEAIQDVTDKLATVTSKLKDTLAQQTTFPAYAAVAPQLPSKSALQSQLDSANVLLSNAQAAAKQAQSNPKISFAERMQINDELQRAQSQVNYLSNAVENYEENAASQKTFREEREKAVKEQQREITTLTDQRERLAGQQLSLQHILGGIDDLANQLFIASDATNGFKLDMSITFAVLVGFVILGFFYIANSDPEIRRTIFSNEAGIQFITLFAIVISVILFGIINVLESKELSALLGGLSGYILGRSQSGTR